ncbi:hypothetical protein Tco_1239393, partial [Tanacetum coccineum]
MNASSTNNTNDANTTCPQVSAASPSVNAASPQVCTASVSDNVVYPFMVENPNGSNVLHQDLDWDTLPESVEHQESRKVNLRNQDNTRKQGNNEDTSSKAMLDIDGVASTYKRGLATVEEQLITYRKNEVLFSEEVAVLKREVACKDYEIN